MARVTESFQIPERFEDMSGAQTAQRMAEGARDSEHRLLHGATWLARQAIYSKTGRRLVGVGLAVSTAISVWTYEQDGVPEHNSCMAGTAAYGHDYVMIGDSTSDIPLTNVSKDSMRSFYHGLTSFISTIDLGATSPHAGDNRTWSDLASLETERRGYKITAAQLANVNPQLALENSGDDISYRGAACITLPAPGGWGAYITDGKQTVQDYTQKAIDNIDQIVALNPGIPVRDANGKLDVQKTLAQVLPAGFVIKTKPKVDLSLFRQTMAQQFYDVYKGDTALGQKIRMENDATSGLNPGDPANLPPVQTPWMKQHGITVADIQQEYAHSYDTSNVGVQQLAKPPQDEPTIPTPQVNTTAQTVEQLQLENYRFEGYHGLTYGNSTYARYDVQYGHQYGIDPSDLMALSIEESADWTNRHTSSTGAQGRMQFEPGTWNEIMDELGLPHSTSRLDPRISTMAGARYISDLKVRLRPYASPQYPLMRLVWDSYNGGEGNVEIALRNGQNPDLVTGDNHQYAAKIMKMSQQIQSQFDKLLLSTQKHETTTHQTITDHVDNIVYYSQTDGQWNQYPVYAKNGASNTLGWVGCWESSMAMGLSTLTGLHITPKDMANFATRNGYIIDAGGVETNGLPATVAAAKQFGLQAETLNLSDQSSIDEWLNDGGFIILAGTYDPQHPDEPFTSAGHDILLRKQANGKYYIGDPANYSNSLKPWSFNQLVIPERKTASGQIVGTHFAVGFRLPGHVKPPVLAISK